MSGNTRQIEEELLVLRCQDGEAEALRELIARWHPRAYRLAFAILGNPELASDASQEACISLVRGIGQLRDPATFPAWSNAIVRRRAMDAVRTLQRERRAKERFSNRAQPSGCPEDPQGRTAVAQAVAALPRRLRDPVHLHYANGLSLRHIARVLSLPIGTVKSRLSEARRRIGVALDAPQQ